eukprot:3027264-Prymnesium_polylepis.1
MAARAASVGCGMPPRLALRAVPLVELRHAADELLARDSATSCRGNVDHDRAQRDPATADDSATPARSDCECAATFQPELPLGGRQPTQAQLGTVHAAPRALRVARAQSCAAGRRRGHHGLLQSAHPSFRTAPILRPALPGVAWCSAERKRDLLRGG